MSLSIVVAFAKNLAIGKDNKLLWRQKADMQYFKKLTQGKTVLMGKNTYWSLPEKFRPLPNRNNIVLTTKPFENTFENLMVFNNIENTLNTLKNEDLDEKALSTLNEVIEHGSDVVEHTLRIDRETINIFNNICH
jgi:dihydrofolate reductase